MRQILFIAVPLAWGFMWFFIRVLMSQRAAANARRDQEPVIEVNWRDPQDYRPPQGDRGPLCERHNLHLFLRMFGAERSCKHCAAARLEQEAFEREEAIREAERHISPGSGDGAARP
jgi:hypothetical protein